MPLHPLRSGSGRGALDRDVGAGKTVVAMGTPAQTSVLHTAGAAALPGFNVIVPVDGMSADDVFPEIYTAWHLATAARIAPGDADQIRHDRLLSAEPVLRGLGVRGRS